MTARRAGVRVLAASTALVIAGACQASSPQVTPAGGSSSPSPGTVPSGSGASATDGLSPDGSPKVTPSAGASLTEGQVEIGDGAFFMADPRVGLDALASYTESLTVSFDGTADGRATAWTRTFRLQHTGQPAVSVLRIEASGDTEAFDPAVVAEAAGVAYELGADGTCSGRPLDPADSILSLLEPAGQLPALMGASEVGRETVDGGTATHYTFDERAILESGGPDTTGGVWVATDGEHVVKFERTTTADAAYFGGDLVGTMTWRYGLSDIDALTAVAPPEGCQVDTPIMDGASNVLALPRYAGFDTRAAVADVIAYYKAQLPTRGWGVSSEPFADVDMAVVEFSKGAQVLNLMITPGDDGLRVDLSLSTRD